MDADGSDDVWAVGQTGTRVHIEHWDGASWSLVKAEGAGSSRARLTGIAAITGSDAWAVGYRDYKGGGVHYQVSEHWDGDHWTRIS